MSRTRPESVDDVRKQWQAAGQALHPFCSFEELASVIEAMAVFPVGPPCSPPVECGVSEE